MLYLNRDIKQGGRSNILYGKKGDAVKIISTHVQLPAVICEHIPANGREPFPASICAVTYCKSIIFEQVIEEKVEVKVKSGLKAIARFDPIKNNNQIKMF